MIDFLKRWGRPVVDFLARKHFDENGNCLRFGLAFPSLIKFLGY